MANEHLRDKGNLFENTQKKKPSQPDLQGDCTIAATAYEIRGWRRGDQLTVTLAVPRGDRNTYPPDVFRGALDPAPTRRNKDAAPTPAWTGDITSDDASYTLRAFEKQGKAGLYFTLSFERVEVPVDPAIG